VRELARLQIQVEILQQQIDDLESSSREGASTESRLSVVGER
jgi:prefoldin subunit 5